MLSCVRLFATLRTVARQAPLSMEFYRQEYWSGLPFPSPGDLPNPGTESRFSTLQADSLSSEPPGEPGMLFIALDLASVTSHSHSWVLFLLWLHPFILSGVISPLISSSIFAQVEETACLVCSHRILLLSPVTATAGYCFCFGSIPSFFLELFLH